MNYEFHENDILAAASRIMAGLLASGHYTKIERDSESCEADVGFKHSEDGDILAAHDAIWATQELVEKLKSKEIK